MWESMILRCEDPSYLGYDEYGGAGIRVCDKWKEFKYFRKWARANGGRKDLVITRIDPNGDYEPSNCQFMTLGEACIRDAEMYMDEVVNSFGLGKYQKMFDLMDSGVRIEKILENDWLPGPGFWAQV